MIYSDIDRKIGKTLKYYRILKGFSQNKLAEELNITFQNIQKYEKGINRLPLSRFIEVCRILKIDINKFIDYLDNADGDLVEYIKNIK